MKIPDSWMPSFNLNPWTRIRELEEELAWLGRASETMKCARDQLRGELNDEIQEVLRLRDRIEEILDICQRK